MKRTLVLAMVAGLPANADVAFEDWSSALPVDHIYGGGWEHFVGGGVAVFDCDGDARPEIWAAGGEHPAIFLRNQTASDDGFVADMTGVLDVTGAVGAYPLDINSDGALDLFVLRVGPNKVFLGNGACGFADATEALNLGGTDRWSTAFSATWESGQDRPTLAVGNYVDRTNPNGPFEACDVNEVYRPVGSTYGPALELKPGYCALSILFSDWARTGTADLRLSNDRHYYVRGGSEQMWRLATQDFLGAADGWDEISLWGMGIASQDITGDARPDIVLTSMGDQLLQYATDGPGYVAAPYAVGTYAQRPHTGDDGRPATGWHAEFADVDNDGFADLFIAKGNVDQMPGSAVNDPNNLLKQRPDGTFTEVSVEAGVASGHRSRGAALADLDGDGRLDLVVVNRRAPMELYRNVSEAGNFVSLTPRLAAKNTRAVGAWIELRTPDGRINTQEVTVGGGHAGGKAGPLHFGLGTAKAAEVRVLWPDGKQSVWTPIGAGTQATLWPGSDNDLRVHTLAVDG